MAIKNLGFLASHRGSNMQSIIDACNQGTLDAVPAVVISNNGDSAALERANSEGIPAYHISNKRFSDADALDCEIRDTLIKHNVDLVVLAGFMKKVGSRTIQAFEGKIINVHPALLPKFGGEGMYGYNVHEKVLASGDNETGVTIHIVTDNYDTGPILAQQKVQVIVGDTVESLANRVLVTEHIVYVDTIKKIINGDITLN
ncbi:MAG: phosphoribosylglycinamide formyltransferase-1 [Gammaproteobacteria bacterium]|jgi:phosphoribosylglycinamide formyltransferase-1